MKINYEALFWVIFVVNIVGLLYLVSLVRKVNDLVMRVGVLKKSIEDQADMLDVINVTIDAIDNRLDPVMFQLNKLQEKFEDAFEFLEEYDEDEEWTPEPEEEEVAEEHDIAVEIDEDPIHLIPKIQFFFENNGYDKFQLEYHESRNELRFYYVDGGVGCDYIVVDNVDECIGEGLKYFGVHPINPDTVYIRNNVFKADFMITKVVED